MPPLNTDLTTLIGSRICHDLISPIGAINNGLELLGMSNDLDGPEMELIGESVSSASARIRFFRISFGVAGDQLVGQSEITSILRDLYGSGRLDLDWRPDQPQPRLAIRLAFLAILCLETAMPFGGRIEVSESEGRWKLRGFADKINFDPTLWAHLDADLGTVQELQPSQVQFGLLPTTALYEGRALTVRKEETSVSIQF